jgi:hypothetical protein
LPPPEQPYFFPSAQPVVSFSWFEGLVNPAVRTLPRLPAGEQPFLAWVFAPSQISISWFHGFTDPAERRLSGLNAAEQKAFFAPDRLLPTPAISGILLAQDQYDVLLAGGVTFERVITASVGVKEITYHFAGVAIGEQGLRQASVGVQEQITVPSSGSPVPPTVTASVAILEIRIH